jgi:hypothetical protein
VKKKENHPAFVQDKKKKIGGKIQKREHDQ